MFKADLGNESLSEFAVRMQQRFETVFKTHLKTRVMRRNHFYGHLSPELKKRRLAAFVAV